jgi:hypothetical protein
LSHFLFTKGCWQGTGVVSFSHSPQTFVFSIQWEIEEREEGGFFARQKVSIDTLDPRENCYDISSHQEGEFQLVLSNETMSSCIGKGFVNEKKLVWEFFHPGILDGFETYERVSETEYCFSAEYGKGEGFVTKIAGLIRRQGV